MLWRPLTLRGRLITALLVFSAVGLGIFGGASMLLLRQSLLSQVDDRLSHATDHIARTRRPPEQSDRRLLEQPPSELMTTIFGPGGPARVGQPLSQSGGPVLDLATVARHADSPFTVPDQAGGGDWRVRAVQLRDHRIVAVALPLQSSVDAVVTNLVTNALTHTPAGTPVRLSVRPDIRRTGDEPPVAHAGMLQPPHAAFGVLEVHDAGPGIPADQAVHVFDRFHSGYQGGDQPGRADGVRRQPRSGSGLGLAITAAILEAHSGRIELRTGPQHGTTFRVLLPLA